MRGMTCVALESRFPLPMHRRGDNGRKSRGILTAASCRASTAEVTAHLVRSEMTRQALATRNTTAHQSARVQAQYLRTCQLPASEHWPPLPHEHHLGDPSTLAPHLCHAAGIEGWKQIQCKANPGGARAVLRCDLSAGDSWPAMGLGSPVFAYCIALRAR